MKNINGYNCKLNIGEDAEINFRLKKDGFLFLYTPKAIVYHRRSKNIKKFSKKMYSYGYATAKISKIHKTVIRWYSWIPLIFLLFNFGSFVTIIFEHNFIFIYTIVIAFYLFLVLMTSFKVIFAERNLNSLLTPILLIIQHVSYGIGSFNGLVSKY